MDFLPLIILVAVVWAFYKGSKSRRDSDARSTGRLLSWTLVVILGLIPVNWLRSWVMGDIPKDTTLAQALIGVLICWGISAALGYYLLMSGRRIKQREAKDKADTEQLIQELLSQPLSEIQPAQAILRSGERAYGAVSARLQEVQTVGYSGNTSGVSFRVAKGVTLRTGGVRAHAVKGAVITATGELVITDKRVLFAGDRKSFEIPLEKILNVTNYADGFGFHDGKKTHTLLTDNDRDRLVFGVLVQKLLRA